MLLCENAFLVRSLGLHFRTTIFPSFFSVDFSSYARTHSTLAHHSNLLLWFNLFFVIVFGHSVTHSTLFNCECFNNRGKEKKNKQTKKNNFSCVKCAYLYQSFSFVCSTGNRCCWPSWNIVVRIFSTCIYILRKINTRKKEQANRWVYVPINYMCIAI